MVVIGLAITLAACETSGLDKRKALAPIPPATVALMEAKGMTPADPIVIRSYKKESEIEVWKANSSGRYALLKTFPICRWSGQLGPKKKQGDRQAPEGFYSISPSQMNPNSSYYLSFDTGYPNAYDRAHGRTGSNLMVHGACSSAGCFAMTDQAISEIYAIGREAFRGGQRTFQFQSYPFRMNVRNMAKYRADPNYEFWKNLKEGSDYFEVTGREPKVSVCAKRYVFGPVSDSCEPAVNAAVMAKAARDDYEIAELSEKTPAVRLVYQDGDQHYSFRNRNEGMMMSRPDAVAGGPREVPVGSDGTPATAPASAPSSMLAFAFGPQTAIPESTTGAVTMSLPPVRSAGVVATNTAGGGRIIRNTERSTYTPIQTAPMTTIRRDTITEERSLYRRTMEGLNSIFGKS
jgi:murein L,D-transpeptidase YafK